MCSYWHVRSACMRSTFEPFPNRRVRTAFLSQSFLHPPNLLRTVCMLPTHPYSYHSHAVSPSRGPFVERLRKPLKRAAALFLAAEKYAVCLRSTELSVRPIVPIAARFACVSSFACLFCLSLRVSCVSQKFYHPIVAFLLRIFVELV